MRRVGLVGFLVVLVNVVLCVRIFFFVSFCLFSFTVVFVVAVDRLVVIEIGRFFMEKVGRFGIEDKFSS